MGIIEKEKREVIFEEITGQNFPNLLKNKTYLGTFKKPPKRTNRSTDNNIRIKMLKVKGKEKIWKAARGKQHSPYRELLVLRLTAWPNCTCQCCQATEQPVSVLRALLAIQLSTYGLEKQWRITEVSPWAPTPTHIGDPGDALGS